MLSAKSPSYPLRSVVHIANKEIRQCVKWSLAEVKHEGKLLKMSVPKGGRSHLEEVAVYERFLTGKTLVFWKVINPLSPKSDQHQISPCNVNAL